jgi:starvation-inducible outer membrane lipoprotein
MKKLLLCAALPLVLAACATGPEADAGNSAAARRDQNEYMTGSNLPRKNRMGGDNVQSMTAEEFARAQASSPQNAAGTSSTPQ